MQYDLEKYRNTFLLSEIVIVKNVLKNKQKHRN